MVVPGLVVLYCMTSPKSVTRGYGDTCYVTPSKKKLLKLHKNQIGYLDYVQSAALYFLFCFVLNAQKVESLPVSYPLPVLRKILFFFFSPRIDQNLHG